LWSLRTTKATTKNKKRRQKKQPTDHLVDDEEGAPVRRAINFDFDAEEKMGRKSDAKRNKQPYEPQSAARRSAQGALSKYRTDATSATNATETPDATVWTFERRLIKERTELRRVNANLAETMKLQKAQLADYEFRSQQSALKLKAVQNMYKMAAKDSQACPEQAKKKKGWSIFKRSSTKVSSPPRRRAAAAAAAAAQRKKSGIPVSYRKQKVVAGADGETATWVRAKIMGTSVAAPDLGTFFFGTHSKKSMKEKRQMVAEAAETERLSSSLASSSSLSSSLVSLVSLASMSTASPLRDSPSGTPSKALAETGASEEEVSQIVAPGGSFWGAVEAEKGEDMAATISSEVTEEEEEEEEEEGIPPTEANESVARAAVLESKPWLINAKPTTELPAWKIAFKAELKKKETARKEANIKKWKDESAKAARKQKQKLAKTKAPATKKKGAATTEVDFENEMSSFVETSEMLPPLTASEHYQLKIKGLLLGPEPDLLDTTVFENAAFTKPERNHEFSTLEFSPEYTTMPELGAEPDLLPPTPFREGNAVELGPEPDLLTTEVIRRANEDEGAFSGETRFLINTLNYMS